MPENKTILYTRDAQGNTMAVTKLIHLKISQKMYVLKNIISMEVVDSD